MPTSGKVTWWYSVVNGLVWRVLESFTHKVAMTAPGTVHLATPARWPPRGQTVYMAVQEPRELLQEVPGGATCDLVSEDPNSVLPRLAN